VSEPEDPTAGRTGEATTPRPATPNPDLEPARFSTLRLERLDDVLRVTIAHPTSPLNAVDGRLHRELAALFRGLRRETTARAVLLTGEGRAFSAGGDFKWFPTLQDPDRLEEVRRDGKQLVWDLLDVEIPIVAAVNGPAIGLGASIALLCDVIFAAEAATFADPHVRVGLVAGDGGVAIWPLALGPARAKQYLLTGDALDAREAERLGLVNFVVPPGELAETSLAFARRLAAGAPLALRYTKLAVNKLVKDALNVAFDASMALEIVTFRSEDHREALAALREKRPPRFRAR
jgi:enoyl-CoA hydratase